MKIEKIPEGYLLARKGGNGCELWRKFNGAESMACDAIDELIAERDELRAKIEAMEKQEPARLVTPTAYRWRRRGSVMWQYGELTEETVQAAKEHNHEVQSLYALPGAQAQPAPSVPECPYPCGWRNLLKLAIEDGAYLARSINTDEPVTENARAVTMRIVLMLRDVLMAINNAAPEAKP